MSKNTQEWLLTVCFLLVLAAAFMVANQRDSIKQEAVDRGFAEWHVIEGTSETEFRWKEAP